MEKKFSEIDLTEDIIKYMKEFSNAYAREAERQLTKKAKSCIKKFYDDYEPKVYDRTFDLKENSYEPYFHNNGKQYSGGVRISSNNMSPYYSGGIMNKTYTEPIVIAQLGWHGWHGDPTGYNGKFDPIKTSPSPLEMLLEFRDNDTFRSFLEKYGHKMASKQRYNYLDMINRA